MTSLLEDIRRVAGEEAAKVFEDAELCDDENIQQLCYDSLKELFPEGGGKALVLRSKIWKVIAAEIVESSSQSSSSVVSSEASNSEPSTSQRSTPKSFQRLRFTPPVTPTPPESSPSSQAFTTSKLRLNTPEYTIYKDKDIVAASELGSIPQELRHRLIRATISNMTAAAFSHPFNRLPSNSEVKEMAKSLVLTYPCLSDSEAGEDLLCKQLQKRLYNIKNGGSTKRKNRRELTKIEETPPKNPKLDEDVYPTSDLASQSDNDDDLYSKEIMDRHHASMMKEYNKAKPNWSVINMYLNKEYQGRRDWVRSSSSNINIRCQEMLDKYPCFKNHVEIVEEVRRSLRKSPNPGDINAFLQESVGRLESTIEFIMCYGISKKDVDNIMGPSLNSKIIHVMKNIAQIFPSKQGKAGKKHVTDVMHTIKDHEDPELWVSQRKGDTPVILLDSHSVNLIVGRNIACSVEKQHLKEAVLAYLGLYYVLDLDYPSSHELGFTLLHYLFFDDPKTPAELVQTFNATLAEFKKFQKSNE